jgi:hypothetical protein
MRALIIRSIHKLNNNHKSTPPPSTHYQHQVQEIIKRRDTIEIVSFYIEIQGFSLAGPAGTEQSKASAATILTTPLLTKSRKTQGKPFSTPFDEGALHLKTSACLDSNK